MPYTTYRSLPIDALYDLLTISIVDLFAAIDSNHDVAVKELRKQIEALVLLIGEKKKELRN
jgi:hypothetical protein